MILISRSMMKVSHRVLMTAAQTICTIALEDAPLTCRCHRSIPGGGGTSSDCSRDVPIEINHKPHRPILQKTKRKGSQKAHFTQMSQNGAFMSP